jgi:ADP-ribosyl-[dinitrogen reductase] hydrolase
MESENFHDRCKGGILGFAVGDALGMPTEFLSREQIQRYYRKPISDFIQAHPGHANDSLPPGSYTSNTQTMLVTAETLLECGRMDPARQAEAMLAWYQNTSPHRTPSMAILRACKHLAMGKPWNKSGVFSSGCSAAMRTVPIGIYCHRNPDTIARAALDNCMITHTEPRARAAAVSVAYLASRILQSDDYSMAGWQVLETADYIARFDEVLAAVLRWTTQIVHLPPEEALFELGTSSDAIEVVPAAIYCFLKFPGDFSRAVLAAANAGEASNAIAALAGSFVGLLSGASVIDERWRHTVENADIMIGIGEHLAGQIDIFTNPSVRNTSGSSASQES